MPAEPTVRLPGDFFPVAAIFRPGHTFSSPLRRFRPHRPFALSPALDAPIARLRPISPGAEEPTQDVPSQTTQPRSGGPEPSATTLQPGQRIARPDQVCLSAEP